MNGFKWLFIFAGMMIALGCATQQSSEDDIVLGDSPSGDSSTNQTASADDAAATPPQGSDDFSEFKEEAPSQAEGALLPEEAPPQEPAPLEEPAPAPQAANEPPAMTEPAPPMEPTPLEPTPAPQVEAPTMAEPTPPSQSPVEITGLKFKGNDNGGTIIVEATGALAYSTRSNPDTKQFIVEIPNSLLPARLKRNLNTKDIEGAIGSIDAYQATGSNTSRIVIQLREGAPEPAVQQEGRSLFIVAAGGPPPEEQASAAPEAPVPMERPQGDGLNRDLGDDKILTQQSLHQFMSGNQKFYGQPISVEVDGIDIKEALRFIAGESGLNMVIAEEVKGQISLKLQSVPWDQALVVLLKAKKLGYARQGSILRIAPLADLQQEEENAAKIAQTKITVEPLKVKVFQVSYAKVEELAKNLSGFATPGRGKIVADQRTSSLVVTDIQDSLTNIEKLIRSLDIQPPQVMIEGKIVEASETFSRQVGVAWRFDGGEIKLGNGKGGPLTLNPTLNVAPNGNFSGGAQSGLGAGIRLGVLDFFGNLDANLKLSESENTVKIISAPRIVTLTNEPAKMNSTIQIPIEESLQTNISVSKKVTFKPLMLDLDVTPQVTSDASVMMKVKVKREIKTEGSASGGASSFGVSSRTADTKILIKNGQTAVIGGIYQSDASEVEDRVPGLGSLPIIGGLFKYSRKSREKIELLIFLTPRIIDGGTTRTTETL